MLGVNDPWVVRHGVSAGEIPGHQRITPISYLLRRHVNLVFSHPMVLPIDASVRHTLYVPIDLEGDMLTVRVVELPLDLNFIKTGFAVASAIQNKSAQVQLKGALKSGEMSIPIDLNERLNFK